MNTHISRSWGDDVFAPECGCVLLECGKVDASAAQERGCHQHDPQHARTIRSQHPANACDQEFARRAFPGEIDYVGNVRDVLGEDDAGYIFAAREGSKDYWERFDRARPNHMAAMERTRQTGRVAFLELESEGGES